VAYATGRVADGAPSAAFLDLVNEWALHQMPVMNREILEGRLPPAALRLDLGRNVLALLPSPQTLSPEQAQRLVVILGLAGASVGRHYQESAEANRRTPERAFAGLTVGADSEPFLGYFARLAERTGTGHGNRDSFASLVRWNLPPAQVHWAGELVATLPSVFDDGLVRSYTAAPDEIRFFGLLKASEALELAVNQQLAPLSDGSVDLDDEAALRCIARAVMLLDALRALNSHFAALPPGQGLSVGYFLDVFRQYAVHWRVGDIPPSGAQDVEAMVRDLLVGVALPSYPEHVRRQYPALLDYERVRLETLLNRPSVVEAALRRAGLDARQLHRYGGVQLQEVIDNHPVLAALHLLLNAHARVAGVHLMLSKRFLFHPQRARDREGAGDPGVVSNRSGTTGMDEPRLEAMTRARHDHVLTPLRHLSALEVTGRPKRIAAEMPPASEIVVRFNDSMLTGEDLGLAPSADRAGYGRRTR
jgi:hypothetical protein